MTGPLLTFRKMEGLGNDFLVVERDDADAFPPSRVASLCDRHHGVGGDGVLLVVQGNPPRMIVLNADGSRPEMCGNGLRCVALHLAQVSGETRLVVETDAGPRECAVELDQVTIDMGQATDEGEIVVDTGRVFRLHRVSMGNPHAITFDEASDEVFQTHGPKLATNAAFPSGTNVEFCSVRNEQGKSVVDVRVWERGVGPTLACGTGACAVAAFGAITGRVPFGEEVQVNLPGGALFVTVSRDLRVKMRGPARHVFSGETPL